MIYTYSIYNLDNKLYTACIITSKYKYIALIKILWTINKVYDNTSIGSSDSYDFIVTIKDKNIIGVILDEDSSIPIHSLAL